jgi:hypothetical protein
MSFSAADIKGFRCFSLLTTGHQTVSLRKGKKIAVVNIWPRYINFDLKSRCLINKTQSMHKLTAPRIIIKPLKSCRSR